MVSSQTAEISPAIRLIPHIPVMVKEVVGFLQVRPKGKYIDATVGCGGHAKAILEKSSYEGELLGIDIDPMVLEVARSRLQETPCWGKGVRLVRANFCEIQRVAEINGFDQVDGILFDLGLSSWHIERSGRGFSFQRDEPLDMRFDPEGKVTAAELVNTLPLEELAHIFEDYGEEKHGRVYARRIVERRTIKTTAELARIIEQARRGRKTRIHPATKLFQALRIAVNNELENLAKALRQAVNLLKSGGRLLVISYHSLEDRTVKDFMRRESRACLCPPGTPVCICGHAPTLKILTTKPVAPSPDEVKANPRSRSARLRVAERI